ncbi:MAG TPA: carbonic anhydrase family protein [Terracidiphilus sp.]|jgi:carbonic anhydrase|nr:carbonic anhydrase family protein [Terracidiphilus sp.]
MRLFRVFALVCGIVVSVVGAAAQATPNWDYQGKNGPLNWGKLDPAYKACGSGHEQSPIDIRGAHLNKALPPVEFHYIAGSVTLENTGRTIIAHVRPGSYIVADGVRYDLQQFHFHHPGEEAVKGRLTDMDVHLVHKSDDGKIAVIAIRFAMDRGEPDAVLAALWPHLPKKAGDTVKMEEMIDPAAFLPADRGYWTYIGSLTAPPCTEGVRWYVYEDTLSMSLSQLRAIAALFPINSRPLQDAHGRRIEANE